VADIAFHFGAPDKLAYACRLLRKATGSGMRVLVLGSDIMLQQLDAALWAVSPTDFITHAPDGASADLPARSSVILGGVDARGNRPPVLVNLGDEVPEGFEQYVRVIEVVSTDEADRELARQRWKHYARLGIAITRHDLALKA